VTLCRGRRNAGFTLVELAVALSIAVVIAGVILVRVDGWSSKERLRSGARTLGNLIRLYRERAQSEEVIYVLRIDRDHGIYRIAMGDETLREGRLGTALSFGKVLSAGAEVKDPVSVSFGPRGLLPELGITIENSDREKITIRVESFLNEVRYVEGP